MESSAGGSRSLAELARASLAGATVATVQVGQGCTAHDEIVGVSADSFGRPMLHIEPHSPLIEGIAGDPVVTVTVAANAPFEALVLRGPAMRAGSCSGERRLRYRIAVLTVSFSRPEPAPVGLAAFHSAQPDEVWGHGAALLDHLTGRHSAELLACVRAHGVPAAETVVATSLNRQGVDLTVLSAGGVTALWLPFAAGPVTSPAELAAQLRQCLTCRCQGRAWSR